MPSAEAGSQERARNLLFLGRPDLWPVWPFLPLVRRSDGQEEECGVLCDVLGLTGRPGHSATVHFANVFLLPPTLEGLLALPREVFDTPEEVFAAGWRID